MILKSLVAATAVLMSIAMPVAANAQTAAPAAEGNFWVRQGNDVSTGNISTVPFSRQTAFTSISVLGEPQPSLDVNAFRMLRQTGVEPGSTVRAAIRYFFSYQAANQAAFDALNTGAAAITFDGISIITDSEGGEDQGFFSSGQTNIDVGSMASPIAGVEFQCGNFRSDINGCGEQSFHLTLAGNNFADAATLTFNGSIRMQAFTENQGDGVQVDWSRAFIDPIIGVSGAGVDPFLYTLTLSPGIGNGGLIPVGPGVPEPASWVMLIAGFGLVGGAVRGRRSREALTA